MESPFAKHRQMVLGHYGTASWLRQLVLAMWNGSSFQVGLSQIASVDHEHAQAAFDMLLSYRQNGERDKAFMALADECRQRLDEEAAAQKRSEDLEDWMKDVGRALRAVGMRSDLVDDRYSWFENQFNLRVEPEEAARKAKAENLEVG